MSECFESVYYEIVQTARICKTYSKMIFKAKVETDLEMDEYAIMEVLRKNENISQRDIAKKVLKTKAHVGKFLDTLESKGFVKRELDTKNNRMIKRSVITKKGLAAYNKTKPQVEKLVSIVESNLSKDEMEFLYTALPKVRNTIEKIAGNLY